MSSSLVTSLARVYDSKTLNGGSSGGRGTRKPSLSTKSSPITCERACSTFSLIEERVDALTVRVDMLLALQEAATSRLEEVCQEHSYSKNVEQMLRDIRTGVEKANERTERQAERLDAVERLLSGVYQAVSLMTELLTLSRLKEKDYGEKVCLKGLKKKRHPDVTADLEEVQKLNQQNLKLPPGNAETQSSAAKLLDFITDNTEKIKEKEECEAEEKDEDIFSTSKLYVRLESETVTEEENQSIQRDDDSRHCEINQGSAELRESPEELVELTGSTKRRVNDENLDKDDLKKSRVEQEVEEEAKPEASEVEQEKPKEEKQEGDPRPEEFLIDCSPPPPAPFEHRVVSPKTHQIASYYDINREEVLGGGRFGMVHKCVEKSSGLTLAAKVIKTRNQKEKEVVQSEIEVMNQLNHANLIQLYAAYESRNDITLVMEYVEGGELFDRIIDENYKLTELDTVLLIRQITEGLQYMHKMYILHLDLKPENILCVSRETNKIKIIDFGLARRYKPREKLRVNFGTPEFLAPEVINYEFVSFPTDMWSLGVITYMLLSGLSPFLGDDDNETLNNILECKWSFEEEEFAEISDEAKDFITRLLVKSKSWRMSASQSLKHAWLSDKSLHYRLHQKKNKCHSTHAPSSES